MQSNLLWTGREYYSLENCVVDVGKEGSITNSTIVGLYEGSLYQVGYTIKTNSDWQTTSVELNTQVYDKRKVYRFESDGNGKWTSDGKACPEFDKCVDVDIPLTPFTNTLPLKRLKLSVGQSQDITVLYFDILARKFSLVRQKYQRLSERQYKYENIPNDFEAVITVDQDCFVVDYPGLFSRAVRKESKY